MLRVEFERYNIPIKFVATTEEKQGVKHFYYGCEKCETPTEKKNYCEKCKADVGLKKVYPEGQPEEVGSRDLWDLKAIDFTDIDLCRITNWKYLTTAGKKSGKKLTAREIAKMKMLKENPQAEIKPTGQLKDLFLEMIQKGYCLHGKIVLLGKVNDIFVLPYPFMKKHRTLIAGIADGNKVSIAPPEDYAEAVSVPKEITEAVEQTVRG